MNDRQFETTNALRNAIFSRQRDLVERCGGYKRVMELTGKSKSEVNRWQGGADQDFIPQLAVAILERDCGFALITAVMAESSGRRLTDPEEERVADINFMVAHAEKMRLAAKSMQDVAQSIADGVMTPTEATIIDRGLAAEERAIADTRAALAVIKARGGMTASLRVVGED